MVIALELCYKIPFWHIGHHVITILFNFYTYGVLYKKSTISKYYILCFYKIVYNEQFDRELRSVNYYY